MYEQDQDAWAPAILRDMGEDHSGVYVIGIRESTADDAWSLMFMEFDHEEYEGVDPDEVDDGMDTYCLVADPGQATYYGGVRACELDGERLHLGLTDEAAQTLGIPVDTTFVLEMAAQQIDLLRCGLARVLTSGRADAVPEQLRL